MDIYSPTATASESGLVKTKMVDSSGNEVSVSKGLLRNALQEAGFDLFDSVAEASKIASLTLSMSCAMYVVLSDEQKANIPESKRRFMDYIVTNFAAVNTWADLQLAAEGETMIDKLLTNQAKIGSIVAQAKGITE